MNYNSIQEILSAGTTNMTVLRNNSKQDDGTDTVTGVPWFTYNGTVASTIYASGNSFIGFGNSVEHLKVNRIDGALWYLYREEGTLYGHYKFLKIRWKGYSRYNQTSSGYALEYDVILWDTGDISLHMISIPAAYNNGTYSLVAGSTYGYTVSTNSPDVTFTKTESGFNVQNNLINLMIPFRYLVRDNSNYYTIMNDNLSSITVATLSSDIFENFGTVNIPPASLLENLDNPEILCWTKSESTQLTKGLILTATPPLPQIVYYEPQTLTNHTSIDKIECIASADVLLSISTDDGQTWKYYNNAWLDASSETEGMSTDTLLSLTAEQWAEIITPSVSYKFRGVLPTVTSRLSKIYIKYRD